MLSALSRLNFIKIIRHRRIRDITFIALSLSALSLSLLSLSRMYMYMRLSLPRLSSCPLVYACRKCYVSRLDSVQHAPTNQQDRPPLASLCRQRLVATSRDGHERKHDPHDALMLALQTARLRVKYQ